MDQFVVASDVQVFNLANPRTDANFAVERQGSGIGIDAFGIPAGNGEAPHRLAESAGDVEETAGLNASQWREQAIGPLGIGLRHIAPLLPQCGSARRVVSSSMRAASQIRLSTRRSGCTVG